MIQSADQVLARDPIRSFDDLDEFLIKLTNAIEVLFQKGLHPVSLEIRFEPLDDHVLLFHLFSKVPDLLFEFLNLLGAFAQFGKVGPTLFDRVLDALLDELREGFVFLLGETLLFFLPLKRVEVHVDPNP